MPRPRTTTPEHLSVMQVKIDRGIYAQLRAENIRSGRFLDAVVEEACRMYVASIMADRAAKGEI